MNSRPGLPNGNSSLPQCYTPNQLQYSYPAQTDERQRNLLHNDLPSSPPPPLPPPRPSQPQYHPREHCQSQGQTHGPHSSDPAAPALPPRPGGTTNRLMTQTTLDFPPPPRRSNKPPELPPRPNYAAYGAAKQTPYMPQQTGYPASATSLQDLPQAFASHGEQYMQLPPPPPARNLASLSVQGVNYKYYPLPPGPPSLSQPISSGITEPLMHTVPHHAVPADSIDLPLPPPCDLMAVSVDKSSQCTFENSAVVADPDVPDETLLSCMVKRLDLHQADTEDYSSSVTKFPPTKSLGMDNKLIGGTETGLCGPLRQQCAEPPKSMVPDEKASSQHPVPAGRQNPVKSPTERPPDVRQETITIPSTSSPPRDLTTGASIRPVTHCIDTPVSFSTWWYLHDGAPDSPICSKCYMDNIYATVFQGLFSAQRFSDGIERRCRFNVPRIIDQLLPDAVCRGSLDTLVLFMSQRIHVPDCKGVNGALGSEGIKWFAVKSNQIPGFVACEACYQDVVCMSQFAFQFEESLGQAKNDTWTCDMCVPFVRKEFELRTRNNDWSSFINEAKARIGMPACPKNTPICFSLRKWFVPVKGQGPPDAVLCVACYCDYILKSGQEALWEQEKQDLLHVTRRTNTCMSGMFHLRMALSAADENKDWSLFWSILNRIAYQEKPCVGDGIVNGKWYTLPSRPEGYNVCGACHAGVLQSLYLDKYFVQRSSNTPTPDEPHLCAFNVKTQRFASYLRLMLQTWFTSDCTAWDAYASCCAAVPTCPRNQDFKNRSWYGWPECVICADCYMDFVYGTSLDTPERMPFHKPVILEAPHICEMYSPRMRQLFLQACQGSPPHTEALFSHVEIRRLVYWQTIPQCRQMLMEEKFLANKISTARMSSVFYNAAGGLAAIGGNDRYTYGAAGVGYGYRNTLELTGAQYNAEANAMSTQLGGGKILIVGQLEQRWLTVE